MSHVIRYRKIGSVRFYRIGHTFIAERGQFSYVATKYACGGGWEASKRHRTGLKMPVVGDVFPTLRDAAEYLLPMYLEA